MFYEDIDNAWKISEIGLVVTIFFLVLLLVGIVLIAVNGYRKFDKKAYKKNLYSQEKVNANFANIVGIATVVIETVQILSLVLNDRLNWKSLQLLDQITEAVGLDGRTNFSWSFWLASIVTLIWLFYAASFRVRQISNLERFYLGRIVLYPRTVYLPLFADIGFIPITHLFLQSFVCSYLGERNQAYLLVDDCNIVCWKGIHISYVVLSFGLGISYTIYVIHTSHIWQVRISCNAVPNTNADLCGSSLYSLRI